jgi:hypothetical protein
MMVSYLACSYILKIEAMCSPKRWSIVSELHSVISQKIELFLSAQESKKGIEFVTRQRTYANVVWELICQDKLKHSEAAAGGLIPLLSQLPHMLACASFSVRTNIISVARESFTFYTSVVI